MKKARIQTEKGEIVCELFDDDAPGTVANFVGLATGTKEWTDPKTSEKKKGVPYYDGLRWHRVIANFMIQGGDPLGLGTGGPGYKFRDETAGNPNRHKTGTLSMANSGPNSNGSQFFITHAPQPHLDGKHTVFGQVKSGQPVVDAIEKGDTLNSVTINEA